jgi:hypothetical protein
MSEEQQQDDKIKMLECLRCKKTFEVNFPPCEVIEADTVSMLVWPHPNDESCPYCGQAYRMRIGKLMGFALMWVPLKGRDDSRITVAPASALRNLKPS